MKTKVTLCTLKTVILVILCQASAEKYLPKIWERITDSWRDGNQPVEAPIGANPIQYQQFNLYTHVGFDAPPGNLPLPLILSRTMHVVSKIINQTNFLPQQTSQL